MTPRELYGSCAINAYPCSEMPSGCYRIDPTNLSQPPSMFGLTSFTAWKNGVTTIDFLKTMSVDFKDYSSFAILTITDPSCYDLEWRVLD